MHPGICCASNLCQNAHQNNQGSHKCHVCKGTIHFLYGKHRINHNAGHDEPDDFTVSFKCDGSPPGPSPAPDTPSPICTGTNATVFSPTMITALKEPATMLCKRYKDTDHMNAKSKKYKFFIQRKRKKQKDCSTSSSKKEKKTFSNMNNNDISILMNNDKNTTGLDLLADLAMTMP